MLPITSVGSYKSSLGRGGLGAASRAEGAVGVGLGRRGSDSRERRREV